MRKIGPRREPRVNQERFISSHPPLSPPFYSDYRGESRESRTCHSAPERDGENKVVRSKGIH